MGAAFAVKLIKILENLDIIMAIELMNAAQAIELGRPMKSSLFIERLVNEYRKEVSFVDEDVVMHKEIEKTAVFLNQVMSEW